MSNSIASNSIATLDISIKQVWIIAVSLLYTDYLTVILRDLLVKSNLHNINIKVNTGHTYLYPELVSKSLWYAIAARIADTLSVENYYSIIYRLQVV